MDPQSAQIIALKALAFIVADEKIRDSLQAETGVGGQELATSADDPMFLAGLLDFLLENEGLLISFCKIEGFEPEIPGLARAALPGAAPDW